MSSLITSNKLHTKTLILNATLLTYSFLLSIFKCCFQTPGCWLFMALLMQASIKKQSSNHGCKLLFSDTAAFPSSHISYGFIWMWFERLNIFTFSLFADPDGWHFVPNMTAIIHNSAASPFLRHSAHTALIKCDISFCEFVYLSRTIRWHDWVFLNLIYMTFILTA